MGEEESGEGYAGRGQWAEGEGEGGNGKGEGVKGRGVKKGQEEGGFQRWIWWNAWVDIWNAWVEWGYSFFTLFTRATGTPASNKGNFIFCRFPALLDYHLAEGAAQLLRANTSFMLVLCSRQIPAKANKLMLRNKLCLNQNWKKGTAEDIELCQAMHIIT